MFESLLKSAFDAGGDIFVYINGFNNPLRGRVQDLNETHFTLFQNGRCGTVLWAFRLTDLISCGLLVGPPIDDDRLVRSSEDESDPSRSVSFNNDSDN